MLLKEQFEPFLEWYEGDLIHMDNVRDYVRDFPKQKLILVGLERMYELRDSICRQNFLKEAEIVLKKEFESMQKGDCIEYRDNISKRNSYCICCFRRIDIGVVEL